ncbi:MAG: cytochrome c peroxidase [Spirochaetota bacterium]
MKIYVLLFSFLLACSPNPKKKKNTAYSLPVKTPTPKDNLLTPEKIHLGKLLFFDPRLSGSNWISCASCHNPALGWVDGLPKGIGHNFTKLDRNTPTILNSAFNFLQFWDGRAKSLEEQALGPITSEKEMNQNMEELLLELKNIAGYRSLFDKAFSGEGIKKETIAKAIASYERTIVSKTSAFDRWMQGEENAVSDAAKKGFAVFNGKAKCVICHSGFNFTDNGFHNIGVSTIAEDKGRHAIVPIKVTKGAFKTPTLRDVTRTAPYMHDGSLKTLEEVVEHYNVGGVVKENLSPNMPPALNLTDTEKSNLVAFLRTLTEEQPEKVELPILPQ